MKVRVKKHDIFEFGNGAKVEITDEGARVISDSGKQVCFDKYGNMLSGGKAQISL